MEMMYSKANAMQEQPHLRKCEESSNFPCKLPALALDFTPLRKIFVVLLFFSLPPISGGHIERIVA